MTVKLRDAINAARTAISIKIRDASNASRTIQSIKIRDASNVVRTVWTFFSVTLNEYATNALAAGAAASGPVTSDTITSTVTGGTGPYTYAWTRISGDTAITALNPTGSSSAFGATCYDGVFFEAGFRLRTTDALGNIVDNEVIVSMTWVDTR